MKKVLFVCIENSCRSQIAEAFAKIYGKDIIEPYSSGSRPSGIVNPKGIASMKEILTAEQQQKFLFIIRDRLMEEEGHHETNRISIMDEQ